MKTFTFRAQAIFSLLEKKRPPDLQNLSSSIFFPLFYIYGYSSQAYNKNLIPRAVSRNWVPGHFAERHFAERTFCRTDILPNGQLAENRDVISGFFGL
jgi:hypothetical protein